MHPDLSLGHWFAARAANTPNRRALTFEGTTWTYGEMLAAHRLPGRRTCSDGGVCHGDRVAFLGLNQPAFFETMFAAARLGAIFVPLNFRLTGPELAFIINDAGVHTLVADELHRPVVDSVRGGAAGAALPLGRRGRRVGAAARRTVGRWLGRRADRRRRGGHHHVHLRHHGAAQGGHAHPCQPLVEQHQRHAASSTCWRTTSPWWSPRSSTSAGSTSPRCWPGRRAAEVVLHRMFDPAACVEDIARYGVTTHVRRAGHVPVHEPGPGLRPGRPDHRAHPRVRRRPGARAAHQAVQRPGRPDQPGLRPDRDVPHGQLPLPRVVPGQAGVGRAGAPVRRDPRRRRGQPADHRTPDQRRGLLPGPERDEGLLAPARGHGGGHRRRGLVPHRRRRLRRRGRVPLHRRPGQGHGHHRRRERLPGRGGERALRPPGRRRRRRHRPARRALGRGRGGRGGPRTRART